MSELLGTLRAAHYVKQVATCMGGWPCKNGPLNCKGDETTINPYKPMLQKGLNPSTQQLERGGLLVPPLSYFLNSGELVTESVRDISQINPNDGS